MSVLETPWDSFEERNLVLQGVLGLLSASDALAIACSAQATDAGLAEAHELEPHPLVFLALGIVSFRDSLQAELRAELGSAVGLPQLRPAALEHRPSLHQPDRTGARDSEPFRGEVLR